MRFSVVASFLLPLAVAADSLEYNGTAPGQVIKEGVKLRILPVGDSVTVGFLSSDDNGYRLKLQENLAGKDPTRKSIHRKEPCLIPYSQ